MMEYMADPEFAAANCLVLNPKMIRDTALGNSTSESGTGQMANVAGLLPGDSGNGWRAFPRRRETRVDRVLLNLGRTMGGRIMKNEVEILFFYHSAPHRSAQNPNPNVFMYHRKCRSKNEKTFGPAFRQGQEPRAGK